LDGLEPGDRVAGCKPSLLFDDHTSLKSTRPGGYGKTTLKSIFREIVVVAVFTVCLVG
jgi:hypothetical protein